MRFEIDYEVETGLTFKCDFKGSISEYAMMWLNLTNNAREHSRYIRDIKNTCTNIIYITVFSGCKEEAEEYLKSLELEIISIAPCKIVIPIVDCDESDVVFAKVEEY